MFKLGSSGRHARESLENRHAFTVTPGVQASVHQDGIVLLHIPTGKVFQSNRTGARIWQGLTSGLQPGAIAAEIGQHYGMPPDLVARDTASFLTALEQHGFVTRAENSKS